MSAPTIKPGTRCECPYNVNECRNDAVRLVTVRVERRGGKPFPAQIIRSESIPMCAPCAAHAEKAWKSDIHLDSSPRIRAALCGAPVTGQNDINFVTCPKCLKAHEEKGAAK